MDELARRGGGPHRLSGCSGRMEWPPRGVYFFMEPGEVRREAAPGRASCASHPCAQRRIAHEALDTPAQHKGQRSGGGNHRGSIFR